VGYICAFRGRRDSYQVPVALAEAGRLDCFITDHYCGLPESVLSRILPRRLSESVRRRFDAALPSHLVRRLRLMAAAEIVAHAAGRPAAEIYERFDPHYGEIAAKEARRWKSDLFMYSPHAWSAFSARYVHTPRKVLFQFHPHHALESAVLKADCVARERAGIGFVGRLENLKEKEAPGRVRGDSAWQLADHVVCASSFTRRSLLEAGARPEQISVAPYGVSVEPAELDGPSDAPDETFHVLFVGSGLQRKGLHHLLMAWQRANLPAGARLTIVARVLEAGLAPLIASTRGAELGRGVTSEALNRLYLTATLFAMPSLIEGFGQVYLEALAHGLPVLGTPNTCCPDLGTEADGVYLTAPGNVDELVANLERLAQTLPGNMAARQRARECGARFTWASFRRRIQAVAGGAA
jgi:glycosyltransferase involved in cell wall biosynthesis